MPGRPAERAAAVLAPLSAEAAASASTDVREQLVREMERRAAECLRRNNTAGYQAWLEAANLADTMLRAQPDRVDFDPTTR